MVTFGVMAVQISLNNRLLCLDPRVEDRGCCQHQTRTVLSLRHPVEKGLHFCRFWTVHAYAQGAF